MLAVTITKDAGLEWSEHPDPVPGDTELLVAVAAAGLNGADILQRKGWYPPPPGIPAEIPGLEMSGEVVAIGDRVTKFEVGDRVMALVGGAAQAELALTDEKTALEVPEALEIEPAGGFMEAAATAFDALFTQAELGAGEVLLVTGAAGGVGVAAVQLGAATGATVVASTRHADMHAGLIELGAAVGVSPSEVQEFGPFDVVLELVGGEGLVESVSALGIGGRMVVIGVGAGSKAELDMHALMSKRARIMGSTMRARSLADRATVIASLERRILPIVESGGLVVPIAAAYPMPKVLHAYDRFSAGAKLGKIVLVTGGSRVDLEA